MSRMERRNPLENIMEVINEESWRKLRQLVEADIKLRFDENTAVNQAYDAWDVSKAPMSNHIDLLREWLPAEVAADLDARATARRALHDAWCDAKRETQKAAKARSREIAALMRECRAEGFASAGTEAAWWRSLEGRSAILYYGD